MSKSENIHGCTTIYLCGGSLKDSTFWNMGKTLSAFVKWGNIGTCSPTYYEKTHDTPLAILNLIRMSINVHHYFHVVNHHGIWQWNLCNDLRDETCYVYKDKLDTHGKIVSLIRSCNDFIRESEFHNLWEFEGCITVVTFNWFALHILACLNSYLIHTNSQ